MAKATQASFGKNTGIHFMKQQRGFSLLEILVVLVLLSILAGLSLLALAPHQRMVKTDDAASALYSMMRQGRIQSITRRQFYALVVNSTSTDQVVKLDNSKQSLTFLANSYSLVDMGSITVDNDETISATKVLPKDIAINDMANLPVADAFPVPENSFNPVDFKSESPKGTFVCYFDPAGRTVNNARGSGTQVYTTFYFSSFDINKTKSAPLLRAITVYGATGGLRFWRYNPAPKPNGSWESIQS